MNWTMVLAVEAGRRLQEYVESKSDQNDSKTFTVLRFLTSPGSYILDDLPAVYRKVVEC